MVTVFKNLIRVMEGVPARWPLRLTALLHDVGKPATQTFDQQGIAHYYEHERAGAELAYQICRWFRLSSANTRRVVFLVRMHMLPPKAGLRVFRRLLRKVGPEATQDLVALREADLACHAHAAAPGQLRARLGQVLRVTAPDSSCSQRARRDAHAGACAGSRGVASTASLAGDGRRRSCSELLPDAAGAASK